MTAGELNERITFQKRIIVHNEIDEAVETWEDYVTVWAAVLPNTGSRFYQALQAQTDIRGIFKVRYRTDLDTTMRVKHRNSIYIINTIVHPEFDKKYLHVVYAGDVPVVEEEGS
jgi:SPP1 family predicted phage head-tail adaptor